MTDSISVRQLKAIAHAGRIELLKDIIRAGSAGISSGDLARNNGLNLTTCSAQLVVLSGANLVQSERRSREVMYKPNDKMWSDLLAFLLKDVCQNRAEITWPLADLTGSSF